MILRAQTWILFLVCALFLSACTKPSSEKAPADPKAKLLNRGKLIYQTACTACHHRDPTKDGSLGPAISGSSLELLDARVVHGKYPHGYRPKRETTQMVAMPQFGKDVPALFEYLNQ